MPGDEPPRTIAHRGFAGVAPENTVAAAVAAAETADAIEVDVQLSADGDAVVFHDARLDAREDARGITDGEGYVWETETATLRETRVLDSDEHVPTLEELLTALPADVGVNLELKNPGTPELRPEEALPPPDREARKEVWLPLVEAVAEVVDEHAHDVLLSSFCEGGVAAARAVLPALPVGVLFRDVAAGLQIARRYDADAIHPSKTAILDGPETGGSRPAARRDVLAAAHEHGWDVNVWTIRTWHEAARLSEAGADGLIADYPELGWSREER